MSRLLVASTQSPSAAVSSASSPPRPLSSAAPAVRDPGCPVASAPPAPFVASGPVDDAAGAFCARGDAPSLLSKKIQVMTKAPIITARDRPAYLIQYTTTLPAVESLLGVRLSSAAAADSGSPPLS